MRKVSIPLFFTVLFCAIVLSVVAATTELPPLPTTVAGWWSAAIVVLVPIATNFIKRLVPVMRTHKQLVPVFAILLGAGCAWVLNYFGKAHYSWVDMTALGGLTVTLRELVNQIITVPLTSKKPTSP